MEENILDEATVDVKASDAAETATTGMISDPISDNVLKYSILQPKTKTPTPHNSSI